jgi:hypothetical protein
MAEIWGAVAVAAATVGSAAYSSRQAGRAARAGQRGADAATAESARQYDQSRSDFAPYRDVGGGAINQLGRLFGLGSAGGASGGQDWSGRELVMSQNGVPAVDAERYAADPAYRQAWDQTLASERAGPLWKRQDQQTYYARATDQDWNRLNETMARNLAQYSQQNPQPTSGPGSGQPDMSAFFQSPGYQFRRDEGTRGLERSAAAAGGAFSGNALKALAEFNSGLASQEFGNYVNQLTSIAHGGQSATDSTAAFGANHANQAGRNALYAGDARASGIANQANIVGQGINSLGQIAGYYSNRRRPQMNYTMWEDG